MSIEKIAAAGLKKARLMAIITVFLVLSVVSLVFARTADYQQPLEEAIAVDLTNLDADELATLQSLFGLANGTRQEFIGGKLSSQDKLDFGNARDNALALISADPLDFEDKLEDFLYSAWPKTLKLQKPSNSVPNN